MQLSVLLLASDRLAAEAVSTALAATRHGVTVVADPVELLREAHGYGLVIIDEVPGTTTVDAVILELRALPSGGDLAILCVAHSDDLEERIRLLEAGADDVITRPFDPRELEARVEALGLRFLRSSERVAGTAMPIGDAMGRRIVSVYSPKGGVGATTIATNLALLAAERHPDRALIIDLDLQFGQVASHLNLKPRQSLLELIRDESALQEPELFRTYAVGHESGLHLLAAPPTPGFASLVTAEQVDAIASRALESFDTVVIDAGTGFDDRTLAIFSRSDTVIVPVLPEIPALNAVHLLVEQLNETGSMGASTMFVLNNLFARDLLRLRDIEAALGASVSADLPYDPFAYLKAVNEGVPVVRSAPKSAAADKLRQLAVAVFGPIEGANGTVPERRGRLLAGLRRRA